jgi:hypothetical protein
MSEDSSKNALDFIEEQLKILQSRNKTELSYQDAKKLEILIKTRNLILIKPTDINEIVEDAKYSDYAVLSALRRKTKGTDTRTYVRDKKGKKASS